jgi:hypothetical protein
MVAAPLLPIVTIEDTGAKEVMRVSMPWRVGPLFWPVLTSIT